MSDYNPNFKVCSCGEVYFPGDWHACATKKHSIRMTEPDDLMPLTHSQPGVALATDPETSREAAASVDTGVSGKKRAAQTGRIVQMWRVA